MAVAMLVLVPLVILQSAAEEVLARGWLMQAVGSIVRSPWPGIVVGGAVWTALHVPSTGWGVADLMLFSAVAGWLTVRTGGLEAAIALHAVNNLSAFLFLAAVGELADDQTAGDGGWELLLADGLLLPVYAAAVVRPHHRFRLLGRTAPSDRPGGVPLRVH